ncbi:VCBS repeat protein [Pelagibacter phage Eyrgjafa EXVC018P]|uniref:VCBS repeat protein n=1 Tax=Pelagibacter phage Eyrgjafa EXVC018P TaxID=2736227 RepID=A0A7S5YB24_9CAUD|nr:VCBS repeat protein [Pelagibacter phage Eyrgjafa EXVC018P]QLF88211.1 VCBS repeat protein [Pelagibacter phage Gjalp EXVC020P]
MRHSNKEDNMQILVLDTFDNWGHMVSKVDKGVLATALKDAEDNLTPEQPKEVIIYQTPEDDLE